MDLLIPSTKRQKLDDGNEVDEGSDSDCIIIDVEQKQSINIQPTNIELGDDLDDDIVWVGQTGGQVCQQLFMQSRGQQQQQLCKGSDCLQYCTTRQ